VDNDISHYFALIASLANKYETRPDENTFYLLADKPNVDNSRANEDIYRAINTNTLINIISPQKADLVAKKIKETGATLFLD
jgi:hypothetical protein